MHGPEQPDQPWQPPTQPAQSEPQPGPPVASGPAEPSPAPAPYGPPPAAPGPYGPPPGAYTPSPGPYGQPPYSAPPAVAWPGPPPSPMPPPPRRTGRTVAIVAGITVPIFVIIIAVVGLLVVPRMLDIRQAGPTADPTTAPAPTDDPLAVPEVGSCHVAALSARPVYPAAEDGQPVDCEEPHSLETIAAGKLEDSTWPDEYSDRARELYAECEQAAEDFLGVAWRSTLTWLVLSVPSRGAWNDGAHWYRCDLTVNSGFYQSSPDRTTGSLRDNAERITCLSWVATESSLSEIEPSDCNDEHQGELAGLFLMPEDADYGDIDALTDDLDGRCEPMVLDFLGVSQFPDELSYWFTWPNEDDFDQWVTCLVSAAETNRAFTASLAGVGSGPLPFA